MGRIKTIQLNLVLATHKTVAELKQTAIRLSKIQGVVKLEQVFPDDQIPILARICLTKVQASKFAAVMTILNNDPDVKYVIKNTKADPSIKLVQISPLRFAQKRKR